jgi:hypothetical protein
MVKVCCPLSVQSAAAPLRSHLESDDRQNSDDLRAGENLKSRHASEAQAQSWQNGRIVSQAKVGEVFTFQLESDSFPQILRQFIQRFSLSNDRQVDALGHELALAFENVNLDDFLRLG